MGVVNNQAQKSVRVARWGSLSGIFTGQHALSGWTPGGGGGGGVKDLQHPSQNESTFASFSNVAVEVS